MGAVLAARVTLSSLARVVRVAKVGRVARVARAAKVTGVARVAIVATVETIATVATVATVARGKGQGGKRKKGSEATPYRGGACRRTGVLSAPGTAPSEALLITTVPSHTTQQQ